MSSETFARLKSDKQQRIIHSATACFAELGYSGTSMELIAERSDIAKGALYRYFTGKKELYMLVVDRLVDEIDRYARQFIEERAAQSIFATLRDHMVSIYDLQQRFSRHQQVLCNVLYQEHLEFKGEVLAKFGKLSTHYTKLILQRGIARGEVRETIDLDAASFIVESVIDRFHDGVLMPYLDHGYTLYQQPQEIVNRKAEQVVALFSKAFGKERPPEQAPPPQPESGRQPTRKRHELTGKTTG